MMLGPELSNAPQLQLENPCRPIRQGHEKSTNSYGFATVESNRRISTFACFLNSSKVICPLLTRSSKALFAEMITFVGRTGDLAAIRALRARFWRQLSFFAATLE